MCKETMTSGREVNFRKCITVEICAIALTEFAIGLF